ncbi:inner membrane protein [Escherichia coli]|uniref:Inner membrane protein n=10 Tax=Enterobacteriaceae TaxID=543 RepID=A0A377BXU0_ECOLX|nr:inner membrane protein [Escherichia coli]
MKLMQIQPVKYRFTTLTFFDYFLKKAKYYCPDAIINPPFDSGITNMDNVELSPATRWGMIATGLLQGLVCYLLIVWLSGKNHSWIVYGVPATVAFSSVLLFSVISFKQKRLWGWLALVFIATLGMSGWLKWQTDGMNPWRAEKALWDFGCYLLLMAMLLLPWIQQSLRIRNDSSRYRYFYQSVWHNVLILLVIFSPMA